MNSARYSHLLTRYKIPCNTYSRQLLPSTEDLYRELCEESIYAQIKPDFVKERKKSRKTQLEIAALKQKIEATSENKTLCPSNREIRLLRYCTTVRLRQEVDFGLIYIICSYCRYLDLTEDDLKKIRGSAKATKKLERIMAP